MGQKDAVHHALERWKSVKTHDAWQNLVLVSGGHEMMVFCEASPPPRPPSQTQASNASLGAPVFQVAQATALHGSQSGTPAATNTTATHTSSATTPSQPALNESSPQTAARAAAGTFIALDGDMAIRRRVLRMLGTPRNDWFS